MDIEQILAESRAEREAYEARSREMQKHAPSSDELDDIREHLTLSHYVGQTVVLEPARWANGKLIPHELQGICPAPDHPNDARKSFYVSDRKGFYHCYGCCIHGNIIRFVQDFQGKGFPETMAFVRSEVKRVTLNQDIVRAAAAKAIAREQSLVVLDPWTVNEVAYRSTRGTRRTRGLPDPTRLFARNIRDLGKLDIVWLTRDTHWLDGDRKVIVEAPQTHFCSHECRFQNRSHPAHEAAARHEPERHGRFNGSITLAKTGTCTMVATVRLAKGLHGAATVQLRADPKPGNRILRTKVRLLSYLGERDEISLGLSTLAAFLSHRTYVEQAFRQAARAEKNHHASYDPMLMEGRRTSVTSVYDEAGMPGSPERKFWANAAAADIPGLAFQRSWAQRELKAG